MRRSTLSPKQMQRGKRSGIPLTVYLAEPQAAQLNELCKIRRVTKATIIRFAVEQLIVQLNDGQLELPLGLVSAE
jgi:hypothetical protein